MRFAIDSKDKIKFVTTYLNLKSPIMKQIRLTLSLLAISGIATAQNASQSVSEFAFDFFKQASDGNNKNVVFSPFSISPTIGMVALGAEGETEQQISKVFHFDLNNADFQSQMGKLQTTISSSATDSTEINIANRIWIENTYKIRCNYSKQLKKQFKAEIHKTDFIGSPEPSRLNINKTIESDTKDYIKDLLPQGSIDDQTRLVLTNAIYFKGKWDINIDPQKTSDREFTLSDGKKIKCPTMYVNDEFKIFESSSYKALQMDYKGKKLSMLILLPNEDINFADFQEKMNYDLYKTTVAGLGNKGKIKVYLPKFKITTSFEMKDALSKMGMPIAFSNGADFSGISKKNDIKISNVYHKAFIEVSEEGTTAAAATAAVMVMKSGYAPQNMFVANRPFIYILHDNETQTILFMGKVEVPE